MILKPERTSLIYTIRNKKALSKENNKKKETAKEENYLPSFQLPIAHPLETSQKSKNTFFSHPSNFDTIQACEVHDFEMEEEQYFTYI